MELGLSNTLLAGDPRLVDLIVGEVKSQGIFDQFRKECIADVDTKPAYQNLHTRVEGSVNSFLDKQIWKPDLNKNQLRETLRKHIHDAPYLDAGVERIVDQVVNPKVYSVFLPQIEDVVYKFLGIERPKTKEKNGACGLKDLLPKDLDPVSPESDKNSLKDVSLESVDAIDDLEAKKDEKSFIEQKVEEDEIPNEKNRDISLENGQIFSEEKGLDDTGKASNKTGSNLNLNSSGKSDDKTEEDEEDSPTFEPIDIMNLNESNISNDSHLSGISELTSHRSRSPDFCNELSRDNFDYSNQDSQLSKVSSDSRLSIVTDFGSSNHASTPIHDSLKDEVNKDKCDVKNVKDNFRAVREFESCKNKNAKSIFELSKNKEIVQDVKDSKNVKTGSSSKENSRDATDSSTKDKYEHKSNKDKIKENESSKSRSRDKNHIKDAKYHKDKSNDRKKERSHSSGKHEKYDKNKSKDKNEQVTDKSRESIDKPKDSECTKDSTTKFKEDKARDQEKKDSINKESKDLKDLYKEKIRELREKKELTEKEKLNKDCKEAKLNKENKDKRDSPRDKKPYKKDHKSSSKNSSSSVHDTKSIKASDKSVENKERKSESRDKGKRDEKRVSKDIKSKNHITTKTDSTEKLDKSDSKKVSKNEEKTEKSEIRKDLKLYNDKAIGKKDVKNHSQSKSSSRNDKIDGKKDNKSDSQSKDKKRRDEKKSKPKDDHSSLRKDSSDRRSTDRDGSNGSNSKSSQSSNSSSNTANSKSSSSSLFKETGNVSNSSSETSDSIEGGNTNEPKVISELDNVEKVNTNLSSKDNFRKLETNNKSEMPSTFIESDTNDTNLPLKKRPLLTEDGSAALGEIKVKKPKFAKNIHEAKKLMKIRRQIEKQKLRESRKLQKKLPQKVEPSVQTSATNNTNNLESVPDEERVQIIEVRDEEYEEPYPEQQTNLTLEERSIILLGGEPCSKDLLEIHSNLKLKLSDMELCIKESLSKETTPNTNIQSAAIDRSDTNLQVSQTPIPNCKEPSSTSVEQDTNHLKEDESTTLKDAENKVAQQEPSTSKKEESLLVEKLDAVVNVNDQSKATEDSITTINTVTDKINQIEATGTYVSSESKQESQTGKAVKVNTSIINEAITTTPEEQCKSSGSTLTTVEDTEDCRYFKVDNEKSDKFSTFLESLDLMGTNSLEDIIECLGGQVVSSAPKAMAPPLPKRKHSSSPLTDILLNNSDNNNDGNKRVLNSPNDDTVNSIKKRKLIAPKKQRLHANLCTPQGLLNGENFVMPLSPESDVSATSEKIPSSNLIKEEKGRHRSSQRYSSDDLYKPRPLFSSSSRRSRRSNQA